MRSEHVSRVIDADPARVYAFAADPDNLPRWAAGLAQADIRREQDTLVLESPMGEVRVDFVPRNDLGVLDHEVTLPSGEVVYNPMRVQPHPDGCEVVFTVRQLDLSEEDFARDCARVADDLVRLRDLIQSDR